MYYFYNKKIITVTHVYSCGYSPKNFGVCLVLYI